MTTRAASGASRASTTSEAVLAAVGGARQRLGAPPVMGFLFASPKHDLAKALTQGVEVAGCELLGCHTAGEFTEAGPSRGGLVALLLASDTIMAQASSAYGVHTEPSSVAKSLGLGFADLVRRAAARGLGSSTTVLLTDPLGGTAEHLVKEVLATTRLFQQLVGGGAGDDGQFRAAGAGGPTVAGPNTAAAVHVFDSTPWGVGIDHGLKPLTPPVTVTRAHGTVLHELDGRPAFDAYRRLTAREGVELQAEEAAAYLATHPLGVVFQEELRAVRAPLAVGPKGELRLLAELGPGSRVTILGHEVGALVAASGRAALQAREGLGGARAAGVLVVDCVTRGMMLGRDFHREVDAIRAVFPETPIVGFLGYGQVARYRGKLDGWHTSTVLVVAIPA